ncbi:MAG: redox-regulated ATPase YchF [Methanohalobium sp.]|uniref:redox-regulated ATPase YchF n=1 Tax=Methanohalobium sp. TaxID=2837493 RepID=UPI00397CD0B3
MSITIGLAGKPNSGKSTFFKSATMADVDIANYPFTTISANRGVTYVRTECPCIELNHRCGNCVDGVRFVPVEVIDVAGLVPDAWKGRGLGNAFLDELRQAKVIIHVIDASGSTDIEGNPVDRGSHDPLDDIEFLNHEITMWMYGILKRNWDSLSRKIKAENLKLEEAIANQLGGAGVSDHQVHEALVASEISRDHVKWTDDNLVTLCDNIRAISKPVIVAANKIDMAPEENTKKLSDLDIIAVSTSSAAEFALKSASKSNVIKYLPGDDDFTIVSDGMTKAQKRGLEDLREFLKKRGGTGVEDCINRAVFDSLDMVVVYPVEDENKWMDKKGRVLPDAYLMKKGSTPHDLAYQVHSDIGDHFLYAVDGRTRMRLGEKHKLDNGDVVKIVSSAK